VHSPNSPQGDRRRNGSAASLSRADTSPASDSPGPRFSRTLGWLAGQVSRPSTRRPYYLAVAGGASSRGKRQPPPAGLCIPRNARSTTRARRSCGSPSSKRLGPGGGGSLSKEESRAGPSPRGRAPVFASNSGIAASSTARPSGGISEQACFAEVARKAEVLAGAPIRGDLQAHLPSLASRSGHRGPRRVAAADEWPSRLAAAVGAAHRRPSATAGPYLNSVEAQAFSRRRRLRRGPPPRPRTHR